MESDGGSYSLLMLLFLAAMILKACEGHLLNNVNGGIGHEKEIKKKSLKFGEGPIDGKSQSPCPSAFRSGSYF